MHSGNFTMKISKGNMINTVPTVLVPLTSTIPRTSGKLSFKDVLGAIKVRWGIRRNSYTVDPGLYAIGKPGSLSDVFVTANYKLSFDTLRKNLDGLDAWILILDTKGINVWCAAGKGTFGTAELIHRIEKASLNEIVTHKKIIVPQLGAVGVAAHEVKKHSGFSVIYGPVRAADIKNFISAGYKTDKKMRRVKFTFPDRLKLVPVELVNAKYWLIGILIAILFLSGLSKKGFLIDLIWLSAWHTMITVAAGFLSGAVLTPLLLPAIPFRSFSLKGAIVGLLTSVILYARNYLGENVIESLGWFFMLPVISSYLAMNFTGTSTYTSLSGVRKEMRIAVPVQIIAGLSGLTLYVLSQFL